MKMDQPWLRIPAIEVSQPVGRFFLCSIPARALLDVSYSIPATLIREDGVFSRIFGNQREKKSTRFKQIGQYIDEEESTFPNSIILSVNYREDGEYEEDESLRWQVSSEGNGCSFLSIPSSKKLASIIDGQHRLEGFRHIEKPERLDMEIPCAVFINLPRAYQAKIFATININQKRVDRSLAYQLFGYDLSESDTNRWPPDMLGVYLARALEGAYASPFEGHIKLALLDTEAEDRFESDENRPKWAVSVACIVEGVVRLISERPAADQSALASGKAKDRSELQDDNAPLRVLYREGKDKTLLDLVTDYFRAVDEVLWRSAAHGSFITKTIGVLALFDVLRDALKTQKVDRDSVYDSSRDLLARVEGVDFSNGFFHASGAGRTRIRNVIKMLTGVGLPVGAVPANSLDEAIARLKPSSTKAL